MMKMKLLLVLLAIALMASTAQANMLKNPSFEEGAFGDWPTPDNWYIWWTSFSASPAHSWISSADQAHWGSKYMKMKRWYSGSTAWLLQTVDVTEGQEYAFSVWAKCPVEDDRSEVWGYIEWLDSASGIISGDWIVYCDRVKDDWKHAEFGTWTAPTSATQAIYYLTEVPANGWKGILFDDAYMGIPLPSFPYPVWESFVPIGDVNLRWTNLDPKVPATSVYVDVLWGTEPNETHPAYDMEPLTLDPVSGQDVASVTVEDLAVGTYYWQVKSYLEGDPALVDYDTSDPNDPSAIKGNAWSFTTATDLPPSVTINTPDMITWHNEPVQLDATVIDIGDSPVFIEWTVSVTGATVTGVTFEPNEFVEDPVVSIDQGRYSSADITNPSFEDGLTGWDGPGGTWTGLWGNKQYIEASDGFLLAYTWDTGTNYNGLSQTLTETFTAETTYTLTVDVANDGYYKEDVQYKVQLLAGEAVLAEDNDEHILPLPSGGGTAKWYTSTVVYTLDSPSDPNFAHVGELLEIRLLAINETEEMSFDNVRLTADPPFPVQPGTTYELKVTATDDLGYDYTTRGIHVYYTACQAAIGAGLAADNPGDLDGDCDTDVVDLAAMAEKWLSDTSLTEPVVASAEVGQALYERWDSAGTADSMLTESSVPDYTEFITSSEWGVGDDDSLEAYRGRITAWLIPPVTGEYIFWIVTDDNGRLWLSTDNDPSNAQLIASESVWAAEDGWGGIGDEAQSSPITLQGDGRAYWLRGGYQEGDGGDHIRIGWASTEAGIKDHTIIEGQYLSDTDPGPVNAGDNVITISGLAVQLAPSFIDGYTPTSYFWSTDAPSGFTVVFDPSAAVEAPTVTITPDVPGNPNTVTVTLLVNGSDEDSMEIDVYDDACLAAKAGMVELDTTDFDADCQTRLEDFAALAETWLDDYTLTEPVEKP